MKFIKKHQVLILLLLILAIAFFFRFWRLDVTPPGLYPDEAIHGNNALEAIETGNYKVFYPENNGREGLYINLIALPFKVFGPHIWTIRLFSAIFGFLTVLGLYLFTKQLFLDDKRSTNIALLSAFFLAISFWHINFSRIGFRGIMLPFCLVWSFYFLFKALWGRSNLPRRSNLLYWILAGVFFGLGFHTYISFRVAPLILIVLLALEAIRYWKKNKPKKLTWAWWWKKFYLKGRWWKWEILILVMVLVALPLGIYFLQNPGSFMGRAGDVSIFKVEHPFKEVGLSIAKTLGMFNVYGDGNWRHNFAGRPQLLWPIGILFVLGFIYVIRNFIKSVKSSKIATCYLLLIAWFFIMLLPCFLSAEGVPHALRAIGIIPIVYVFAALGFYWLLGLKKYIPYKKFLMKIFPVICLLLSTAFFIILAYAQYDKYFVRWGRHPEVQGAFTQRLVGIGNLLNTLEDDMTGFVIVNEGDVTVPIKPGLTINYYQGKAVPMPAQTVMFVAHKKTNVKYILPDDIDKIIIKDKGAVIIPIAASQELFNQLKQKFPQGEIGEIEGYYFFKI